MNMRDAITVYNLEKERRAALIKEYNHSPGRIVAGDDKSGLSKKIKLALVFGGTTLAVLLLVQMLII
jgi:hypothetical protein